MSLLKKMRKRVEEKGLKVIKKICREISTVSRSNKGIGKREFTGVNLGKGYG